MANPTTGLFETAVAAFNEGAAALKFSNTMLENVYMGHAPATGGVGETISINVPTVAEGDVVDIGAGDIEVSDNAHATYSLTINTKLSIAKIIRGFDQLRSPADMRRLYSDAWLESLVRKANRAVCNLVTSANFASYSSITGGADTFTRANLATAWNNLAGGGAPLGDAANLRFVTGNTPYSSMLADTAFFQESLVGVDAAEAATRKAVIMPQYGAEIQWDQMFPQPSAGATYAGLFFHKHAIAMRAAVEPSQADSHIEEFLVYPKPNLPIKVQTWNSGEKQGRVFHMSLVFGLKVVRPEYGSYLVTT